MWADATELLAFAPGRRAAESVVFGGEGRADLFAAGSDPTVRRWRLEDGIFVPADPLGDHGGIVESMVVGAPDGILYTAGREGSVRRWDTGTGGRLGEPLLAHRSDVVSLSAAGPGRLVSTDECTAILWDLRPERVVDRAGRAMGEAEAVALGLGSGQRPCAGPTA